jgi:hypothetical protein
LKALSVQPVALAVPRKNERKPSPIVTWPVNEQPFPLPVRVPSAAKVSVRSCVALVSAAGVSVSQRALPVQSPASASKLDAVGARFASPPLAFFAAQNAVPSAIHLRSTIRSCSAASSTKRWLAPSPFAKPSLYTRVTAVVPAGQVAPAGTWM